MIKVRRTITAVCLATLMTATSLSTITPFPQITITAEAASTISVEQAGKKIAKAQDKAFNTKKDVTVTVKVKCSSKKEYDIGNIEIQVIDAVAKAELGDAYNRDARCHSAAMERDNGKGYPKTKYGYDYTTSLKGGVLTLKFTIHGERSYFQKAYRNNSYLKQNVADLKQRIEGMDEKDKAWEVAVWLNERVVYDYEETAGSDEAVYKKQASGKCGVLAKLYLKYALLAGVEKPGYVECDAADHAWNCVKIDGETYYLDMQDIDSEKDGYEFYVEHANDENRKWMELREMTQEDLDNILSMSRGEYYLKVMNERVVGDKDYGKPSQWKYKWRA